MNFILEGKEELLPFLKKIFLYASRAELDKYIDTVYRTGTRQWNFLLIWKVALNMIRRETAASGYGIVNPNVLRDMTKSNIAERKEYTATIFDVLLAGEQGSRIQNICAYHNSPQIEVIPLFQAMQKKKVILKLLRLSIFVYPV